jgi:hypothetical protein
MLIRISLVIAIIAGLAVGGLNFVKVKEKITTLQTNLKTQTARADKAEQDLAATKKELDKTVAELKQTKTTLEATTAERDKAVADVASLTKKADQLTEDLNKTKQERNEAQQELAAYKATGLSPEQITAFNKQYKTLEANLAASEGENKILLTNIKKLETELALYKDKDFFVTLPAGLKGKVLVADPKWHFVVLNVGEDQGLLKDGELLVNRNGRLVAKVRVSSVQKDRSVANVMPGWQLSEVLEGDQVVPAHPAS